MIRLCLAVALPAEARAWTEHFGLEPVPDGPLPVYRGEHEALVVTGVGEAAAAASVGFLAARVDAPRTAVWVNAGIAGHRSLARGEIALVDRCIHRGRGEVFYPSLPVRAQLRGSTCISVDRVEETFAEDALYDMESFGFYQAAARFSYLDLVHAVKVVSDNRVETVSDINRTLVGQLVGDAVPRIISSLIDPLLEAASRLAQDEAAVDLSAYLSRWHFSVSNRHRLRAVLGDYQAVYGAQASLDAVASCANAREVLERLRHLVDDQARGMARR